MFKRLFIPLAVAALSTCRFKGAAVKLSGDNAPNPKDRPATGGSAGSKGVYSNANTGQVKAKRAAKKKRSKKKTVRQQQGKKVKR